MDLTGAILLGDHSKHAALNAAARKSGFTEEQIENAHKVARGDAPLPDRACDDPCEGELYYNRAILWEGRCAIVCSKCGAMYHDRNEQAGIAQESAMLINTARKQGRIKGVVGHG